MQKVNIIPQIVLEILKFKNSCNLIGGEHFYLLRIKFFPVMQFSQNGILNCGASFKAKKIMLHLLKCQTFHFWSKFVSFTQSSRQHFPKSGFVTFQYIWRNALILKIKKTHRVDLEKNAPQTDGQTGLILQDPFYKDESLIMFFGNLRIKLS